MYGYNDRVGRNEAHTSDKGMMKTFKNFFYIFYLLVIPNSLLLVDIIYWSQFPQTENPLLASLASWGVGNTFA